MNVIPLKEKLDFEHYQRAVKALADIDIEVADPYDPYSLEQCDRVAIEKSRKDFANGKFKSNEQVLKEAKQEYESILG